MRKKILSLLIIFLSALALAFCFTACNCNCNGDSDDGGDAQQLSTPSGLSVNFRGVVKWNDVSEAEGYELRVNNEIVPCAETTYNLWGTAETPKDQYTIRVRAVAGGNYSEWSELVTYTYKMTGMSAPVLSVKEGKLTWLVNGNASKVIVTVNDTKTELSAKTSVFDLSGVKQDSVISVQFIGDGVCVADSEAATVIYYASSGKIGLAAPTNVRMNGYELTFDSVYGANIYYLLDVENNVTAITTNSSDRTSLNLIKSVWAGDTRGTFEDSESVNVTYYAEGKGTEQDPFMISSPEELRYIEFYESLNESMYYKFKTDIALVSYVPGEEEEYNNFFNLGSLSGVIDGNGHKLSNSVVYFRDGYSSLFDSITPGGVIKNLVIDNANFRTWTSLTNDGIMHEKGGECAVLAYTNRGTIENITVIDSYIYAVKDGAAGLVSVNKGTISNCVIESSTSIYGANEAGGIAIFNSGTISNCINRASVSGETTVGGIVGRNNGLVTKCGNEGKIKATTFGGGIVGYNYNIFDEELLFKSTVSECYNHGEINVVSYGGGIAGKNGGDGINEVGKVSYANAGIFSSYNTGAINGANSLGGIVGDNYSYHEAETDLGVVNCYNTASITIDTAMLKSTRVYLSVENCTWDTSDGGALFYMHFWGNAGESAWPGVRMTQVIIKGVTYYYADMSIKAEQLTGVIFNRVNPETKEVWSQSNDITGRMTTGNLLFKINDSWTTATWSSSKELVDSTPTSAGGIAGFSNMINDCYYLASSANALAAGVAKGDQNNIIVIGGQYVQSSACQISSSALSTFASILNAYANVWEDSADGPILKWQKGE